MLLVHPSGRGTYLVAIWANLITTIPRGKPPVFVDFSHWPLLWPEKTNVGVDDVVEVNSSTLCVFGVGVGP